MSWELIYQTIFEVVNSGVLQEEMKGVLDDIDLAGIAGKV